ncbi:RTA1-domain-containing protein [Backusella circina FSU 941]|nr:RTA1-domain-containing protein [Backusella circina FSU 941]
MSAVNDSSNVNALRFFHYVPSLPLAIVGAVAFALAGVILSWITFRSKAPRYLYILPITAFCELVGYICRILCHSKTTLIIYIIQQMFLLLSPNALALVNYKTCGEIIRLSNVKPRFFFLRQKFVTWFFFWSDIFAFFLQGSGGGLQVKQDTMSIGNVIVLVGLYVQLFFFASFTCIIIYVHRNPEYTYEVEGVANPKKSLIRTLYITMALLLIRSIYRVVEYQYGYAGPVASAEWAFYVFDGLVILFAFIFYAIPFLGKYLPKRGQMEVKEDYEKSSEAYTLA